MMAVSQKGCFSSLLIWGFLFSGSVAATGETDLSFTCEKDVAMRQVEIVRDAEFACRVKYVKPSGTSFPWSARNESGYCTPKAIELLGKLTSYGWECESTEDVKSILRAQIERYGRYIKILNNVGKTCNFYPAEAQFGNVCGDGRTEAAIVYTCEVDAADWDQHLAVFLEIETEPLIMEVGSSGSRQVSSYYVENERIVMETEQLSSTEDTINTKKSVSNKSIQCHFSATTGWELSEND